MATINIKGYEVLIDEEDLNKVQGFTWYVVRGHKTIYFKRDLPRTKGKYSGRIYLHRSIMNVTERTIQIDHKEGIGLDNRKSNLRLCSNAENNRNKGKYSNNKSGYKGVHWNSQAKKWQAEIWVLYKRHSLGRFLTPELAHEAYKEAAKKYHGEFARTE